MASQLQVGVLEQTSTATAFQDVDSNPWILAQNPNPLSVAPLPGSIQMGTDGDIYAVQEATSANNTDRWARLSQREACVVGGTNINSAFAPATHTVTNGTTTEVVNGNVMYRDRISLTADGNDVLLSDGSFSAATGLTLASADSGTFLAHATWTLSAAPDTGNLQVQIYDNTSAAQLGVTSMDAVSSTGGGSVWAFIRKTSGTAMELVLRITGTCTNSPVMSGILFSVIKLGPLDPNPVTAAHSSAVTRPAF